MTNKSEWDGGIDQPSTGRDDKYCAVEAFDSQ